MPRLSVVFCLLGIAALGRGVAAASAADRDDQALSTALQAEKELTGVITKASAAFVFIGGGSGFLVSPDGYILTNHHVAGDRKQWTVRIEGSGNWSICDLVGTDPVGDLALLKVRDGHNLPYVEFGDIGAVRVGQQVLAVGDPFKLADMDGPPSFSLGTVSALHRFQQNYCDAIQTDCAVNPGNSGGPLLTLDGKLIGITGQIMSRFGAKANTGIAYAIPVDQILRFYPLLKDAGGKVVYHGALPDGLTFTSHVEETQVAEIESVDPGSDGERAGFKAGDKILSVDGKRVYNHPRLLGIVRSYPENSVLDILLERHGQPVSTKLTLPRMPALPSSTTITVLGATLEPHAGDGLRVAAVAQNSSAARGGLLANDVVTAVDGHVSPLEWHDVIGSKHVGDALDIRIKRGNESRNLSVIIDAKPN